MPLFSEFTPDEKRKVFRSLLRVRRVEETIAREYAAQEMRCPVHLSIGQEAIAVGVSTALRESDLAISNHRSHAHYLAKGGNLKAMLGELYGRQSGCCEGRGGSMHLIDTAAGFMGALPIVAGSIPIGVGVAFAAKKDRRDAVTVIYVGDAAMEEGVAHESLNLASVHELPVVFVCENNLSSVYTPYAQRQPARPLTDLAAAHGIATSTGNGNDIAEVYDLAAAAVATARSASKPAFIELSTYRWLEHCGPNYDNDIGYRSQAEAEAWMAECPLEAFRKILVADGILGEGNAERAETEIAEEIADAFAFARDSAYPDPSTAGDRVYA